MLLPILVYSSNNSLGTFQTPEFNVYLPMGDPTNAFSLYLIVEIRHQFKKSQQFYLAPIAVDKTFFLRAFFICLKVTPDFDSTMNTIANTWTTIQGNRSQVSQQITSLTSVLDFVNRNQVEQFSNNDISSFYISSLDGTPLKPSLTNQSISFDKYLFDLNQRAVSRQKFMSLYQSYHPETIPSLLLISSTINQLIFNPNELLHSSLV